MGTNNYHKLLLILKIEVSQGLPPCGSKLDQDNIGTQILLVHCFNLLMLDL